MITSKLTSKAQTTIPRAVCNALELTVGDELVYEIEDGQVTLRRLSPAKGRFAIFSEWDGEADRKAYAEL